MPVSPLDFPAVSGLGVTEAHVKVCAERGHATYSKDGRDTGVCPRCGEVKPDYLADFARREVERVNAERAAAGRCYACDWNLRSHQHTCR